MFVCQDYKIRCQRRARNDKIAILTDTREIDLCSRLASFFGPVAHLAAQGTDDIDLVIDAPTIRAEVKYFKPTRAFSGQITHDWEWLLATSNTNKEFKKRVWAVFWPSADLFTFPGCLTVTKGHGTQFSPKDFAPFLPYAEAEMPKNGNNQRLRFKKPPQKSLITIPGGKRVRVDIVGFHGDPLWCAIYSRVVGASGIPLEHQFPVNDTPIQLP